MLTNELTLSLFGIGFKFFFEDKKTKSRLKEYFSPFLKNIPHQHVFWVEKEKIRIDQAGGNKIFSEAFPLIDALITNINTLLFKEVNEFLIIHAGVVKKEERLLFFPGFSGSGKSTITALFVLKGWEYLGDDLVFINFKDKKVYPYPTPLKLKAPPQKLERLLASTSSGFKMEKFVADSKLFYLLQPKNFFKTSYDLETVGGLLFPLFLPGKSLLLNPLNATDIFKRILPHSLNFYSCPQEAFNLVLDLSKKTAGFEFVFSELEHVENIFREETFWANPVSQKNKHG